MKTRTALATLALIPLVACGGAGEQADGDRKQDPAARGGVLGNLENDQVAALIALINGTEVAAARAVEPKLVLPASRAYARTLIEDHTRLMEAMPSFDGPRMPPPQVHTMQAIFHSQAAMLATLPAGTPFDATVAAIQIADHAMAIDSLRRWHGVATDPELRRAIARAVPVMESHLARAQSLFSALDRGAGEGPAVRPDSATPPGPPTVPADTAGPAADTAGHDHGGP